MEKARIIFWVAYIIFWSGLIASRAFKNESAKAISWSIACFCLGVMTATLLFF